MLASQSNITNPNLGYIVLLRCLKEKMDTNHLNNLMGVALFPRVNGMQLYQGTFRFPSDFINIIASFLSCQYLFPVVYSNRSTALSEFDVARPKRLLIIVFRNYTVKTFARRFFLIFIIRKKCPVIQG